MLSLDKKLSKVPTMTADEIIKRKPVLTFTCHPLTDTREFILKLFYVGMPYLYHISKKIISAS